MIRGSGFSRDEATAAREIASRLKPLPRGPGLTDYESSLGVEIINGCITVNDRWGGSVACRLGELPGHWRARNGPPEEPAASTGCDSDASSAPGAIARGATPGAPTIVLNEVTVWRGRQEVLKQLSLTIAAGSITVIVGPSGVGKTTLISTLNGLVRPAAGRITIGGLSSLADASVLREHRRRTATVFQEYALIGRLTALDNVLLGLADARHPLSPLPWSRTLQRRAAQALMEVGLLHRAHARTEHLSGGERQRVGIARALVRQPTLLLGDEPFSSVDPALTRRLGDEFRSLVTAAGITVVLVTHQIEVARRLGDRIVGLAGGRIAFDGPPDAFDGAAQSSLFPSESASRDASSV